MSRNLAHFNWATLVSDIGTPEVAGFVDATGRVNDIAQRSPGFVWRCVDEMDQAVGIDWPMFRNRRVVASFSVWRSASEFERFVYKTVHGAFLRRRAEWVAPDKPSGYVLWWVDAAETPSIYDAKARVDQFLARGAGPEAFDLDFARAQGWV